MAQEKSPLPEGKFPENDWLPIYDLRTPYSEDEIVSLITEIIQVYAKLCSPWKDGHIIWAPDQGHEIKTSLCEQLGMDPVVISLLRRLPYPTPREGIMLKEMSMLINYLDEETIRYKRSSGCIPPFDLDEEKIKPLPHDVQISGGGRDADHLWLDTKENTIRVVRVVEGPDEQNPPDFPLSTLEHPEGYYYRNYFPRHAPSYRRLQLFKLRSLDVIPGGGGVFCDEIIGYVHCLSMDWVRRKMKHLLIGTYGWPDAFQQERYKAEMDKLWEQVIAEWEALGEPRLQ